MEIDLDITFRLVAAILCGGAIGLERDLRRLPTGFRTMAIVCLGACIAAIAGLKTGDGSGFSRVAQGVVTGIGFLGAGVILQRDDIRRVKGLTTAASIWLTAAIGLLCGLGEFKTAVIATALAIMVLLLDWTGYKIWPRRRHPSNDESETWSNQDRGAGDGNVP